MICVTPNCAASLNWFLIEPILFFIHPFPSRWRHSAWIWKPPSITLSHSAIQTAAVSNPYIVTCTRIFTTAATNAPTATCNHTYVVCKGVNANFTLLIIQSASIRPFAHTQSNCMLRMSVPHWSFLSLYVFLVLLPVCALHSHMA